MKKIVLFLFFCEIFCFSFAQNETNVSNGIENIIEDLSTNSESEVDYTQLFDELSDYLQNPLNLNLASREQLARIRFLNELQVENILNYRTENGDFLTLYELQLVEGLTITDIQKLLPFVSVKTQTEMKFPSAKNLFTRGNHTILWKTIFNIEREKGFSEVLDSIRNEKPNNFYLGDQYRHYFRWEYRNKNFIRAGITAEKDAGEEFFTGTQKNGFDFYSAYFQINDFYYLKTLSLGDFEAQIGQGLILYPAMSGGKSSMVLNIKRNEQIITKYSSTDENKFMRGVATTLTFQKFKATIFFSKKKIDGNISLYDSLENEIKEFSSFENTGWHTLPKELETKDAIDEEIAGGNLNYRGEKFNLGFSALHYQFGSSLKKDVAPYSQFDFQGNNGWNASIDYQAMLKNIIFFGEAAIDKGKNPAFLNGVLLNPAPQVSFSILHRYFDKKYLALYGNAFKENSKNANENGIYLGTEILPYKNFKFSAYFDTYRFEWLRFQNYSPSSGFDYLTSLSFQPTRRLNMEVQWKQKVKFENETIDSLRIKVPSEVNRKNFRYQIAFTKNKIWKFTSRLEISQYQKSNFTAENGFLLYQDVAFIAENQKFAINFRYSVFEATYNTRIYAYESDILYSFTTPAHYGKGFRTYLMFQYTPFSFFDLWIRYSMFYYTDRKVISEGTLSEINGNIKSDFKIEVRIKF